MPNADETHDVPDAFWKVFIAEPKGEPLKLAAFIMDQDATTGDGLSVALIYQFIIRLYLHKIVTVFY